MPGVLQVEAMAQVASILMLKLTKSGSGRLGYFVSADEVNSANRSFPATRSSSRRVDQNARKATGEIKVQLRRQ
jgi:3-hydroxymyristoyl/3-hydroxydecanoyl-(acyl carrier protein) dehydratase